jgi:hypothetical protein
MFNGLEAGDVGDDYRFGSANIIPKVSTYYGFHDKWLGAITSIHDLYGIAPTLAGLVWKETLNLAATNGTGSSATDYTNTSTNWNTFPIQEFREAGANHTSQKVRRFDWPYTPRTSSNDAGYTLHFSSLIDGNQYDNPDDLPSDRTSAADAPLFMAGKFIDPNDLNTQFVVVANRRTWPVRFDSTSGVRTDIMSSDGTDNLLGAIDVRNSILNCGGHC